jgi:hypothetical protein
MMDPMSPRSRDKSPKKLRSILRSVDRHWVGNGFPVRTLFAYASLGEALSPFFLGPTTALASLICSEGTVARP